MAVEQRTPNGPDASRMVLLVVPRQKGSVDNALRTKIRKELAAQASPAHVPALIVEVEELPATHSGKRSEIAVRDTLNGSTATNTSALSNARCLEQISQLVAAEDERNARAELSDDATIADKLRDIWERTLNVSDVDPDDTFFELGGTSLMAVRLCQEISNRLGVTLGPWILFQAPTLKTLTAALSSNTSAEQRSPIVPLKPRGNGPRIFMIPGMYGDVMELRALTNNIVSDRPLYGIRARGLAPGETPHHSVEEIAKDYVEHLRRVQPSGPLFPGGILVWRSRRFRGGVLAAGCGRKGRVPRPGRHGRARAKPQMAGAPGVPDHAAVAICRHHRERTRGSRIWDLAPVLPHQIVRSSASNHGRRRCRHCCSVWRR